MIDEDKSESIEFEEMQAMFEQIGLETSKEEIMILFREIDKDNSGTITYNEFLEFLRVLFI